MRVLLDFTSRGSFHPFDIDLANACETRDTTRHVCSSFPRSWAGLAGPSSFLG